MKPGLWRAWLTDAARRSMMEAAIAAHPTETGGILVGVLAGRRPWVTAAIEVRSSSSTRTSFEIEGQARARTVASAQERDPRLGYLGEWHSHPADQGPSGRDIASMLALAADPDAGCRRPVLLIVRRTNGGYEIDARQAGTLKLRRLNLLSAGPPAA